MDKQSNDTKVHVFQLSAIEMSLLFVWFLLQWFHWCSPLGLNVVLNVKRVWHPWYEAFISTATCLRYPQEDSREQVQCPQWYLEFHSSDWTATAIRRQQRLDGNSEDGAWAHCPHVFPNKCPSLHSLLKSLPLCVPVICLEWASTQLASAFDGVQEPATQASFGLQMSNFFLILVAKTNAWALFIKEEGERVG